jgi:hypothetical protein
MIAAAIAKLPVIDTGIIAPSEASGGHRIHTVKVGASSTDPFASYHKFIPSEPEIEVGDSIFFIVDDHIDIRSVLVNSSGFFQPTNPLVGGSVLETVATAPGGRMIEHDYYVFASGNPETYTTGFISSGWMTVPEFPDLPGLGTLPANWTATFNRAGSYPIRDSIGGYCPSYTGYDCDVIMKGVVTVSEPPEPDSAVALLFPLWGLLAVFLSYF